MKNAMGHLAYIIEGVQTPAHRGKISCPRGGWRPGVRGGIFVLLHFQHNVPSAAFRWTKAWKPHWTTANSRCCSSKRPQAWRKRTTIVSKLLARDFNNELIHLLHADSVTVHFPTPTKWTLDGEYGGEHTDVSVQVLANALHMVF